MINGNAAIPRELLTVGEAETLALPQEPGCVEKADGWERAGGTDGWGRPGGPAGSGGCPPAQRKELW